MEHGKHTMPKGHGPKMMGKGMNGGKKTSAKPAKRKGGAKKKR